MKMIKSAQFNNPELPQDFVDSRVRSLAGHLAEIKELSEEGLAIINQLQETNTQVSLQEALQTQNLNGINLEYYVDNLGINPI